MHAALQARNALRSTLRATMASSTNSVRCSSTSTMHDNDPEVLEREKRRNLSRSQHKTSTPHEKEAPGWNEYLASASEANVKADKSTTSAEDLQSVTVRYVRARHLESEGIDTNTTAEYTHDTVRGPLSGAKGKEEVQISEEKVFEDDKIRNSIASELVRKMRPTESEEDVKADRGEI